MCYTAILKFAVTNSIWDVAKYRKPEKFTLVYNPLNVTQMGGLFDDDQSMHFRKMKKYIENNAYYDPKSPYTALKWYVHVNDPDYKPHFPTKPWDPTGHTDGPPRQTTVGHELDGRFQQFKRLRSEGIRRRTIKLKTAHESAGEQQPSDAEQPPLKAVPYYQRQSMPYLKNKQSPTVRQVLVSNVCLPCLYTYVKTLQNTQFRNTNSFSPFLDTTKRNHA